MRNLFRTYEEQAALGVACVILSSVPLGLSGSVSVFQDLSGSWCIKRTGESMTRVDLPALLMHHDPDRSWITDPDPDHPKEMQP